MGSKKYFIVGLSKTKLTCSTVFVWKTFPHEGFVQSENIFCIKIMGWLIEAKMLIDNLSLHFDL